MANVAALERLFNAYGLPIPTDTYAGNVQAPTTLKDAAQIGVEAEKANVAMYDGFLTFVKEPDIAAVFTQLRSASQAKHLPAFQKALSRNTNTGLLFTHDTASCEAKPKDWLRSLVTARSSVLQYQPENNVTVKGSARSVS